MSYHNTSTDEEQSDYSFDIHNVRVYPYEFLKGTIVGGFIGFSIAFGYYYMSK